MTQHIHPIAVTIAIYLTVACLCSCSITEDHLPKGIHLTESREYKQAEAILTDEIDRASEPETVARAYKYRAIARVGLKEYREAFTDMQIAWKLSCTLAPKFIHHNATAPATYSDCNYDIPERMSEIKLFLSDFAAIMATQDAVKILKSNYPAFAR